MSHRSLTNFHQVCESIDQVYLIMELLPGGNMLTKLKSKIKYSEKEIAQFMVKLIKGLSHMAKKGFIHRDIKLENIMLQNSENLESMKICDFGLAIQADQLKADRNKNCGTPGYLAPEVIANKIYDNKIDIFSSGVVLFTM